MALFQMNLSPLPYRQITEGKKTIELRLLDERRRDLRVGDSIEFTNRDDPSKKFTARVEELYVFDSFDELYKSLPLIDCGYSEEELPFASPRDMDQYYTQEQQKTYKALGIRISL